MQLSSLFNKPILPFVIAIFLIITHVSCKQKTSTAEASKEHQGLKTKDTTTAMVEKPAPLIPTMAALPDSGKPFFRVAVYKAGKLFTQYEGDWAIALQSGKLMSIQFPASRRMLKISHGMIMYFNSPSVGTFPVVFSGNEKAKPVVIFTPEVDGAYGIGVSAATGTVNITSYEPNNLAGTIEAEGKDEKGNTLNLQAAFIHVKNNISD
jgi:hypothetical protein